MKFMTRLQCLMGGNVVQFQGSSTSTHVQSSSSSSSLDHINNTVAKKKKTKKKKKHDRKVIKVFTPDGEINLYHKPIMVSEVMTKECMVCRSDSFYIGQKIPPLSQHDRLQPGHTYFLLPAHLFHSVLSFVTIASFTSCKEQEQQDTLKMKAAFLKKAAASSPSPFDIQKSPSGTLRIRVSELFISQLMMDQAAAGSTDQSQDEGLLCTTPQLLKEYKQLVVESRRGWKPKLDMIKETPVKGKRKVKMLLSASISRMKRKMKKNKNVQISSPSASASASVVKKRKKKTKTKTKKSVVKPPSVKVNKFTKTST